MPEPFYRRDYGLGTVEEARKKKSQPTFENILQDKSSFMRNTDANKTRGLLSAFETASKAKEEARKKEVQPQKNPWELPIPGGGIKKPTGRDGSFLLMTRIRILAQAILKLQLRQTHVEVEEEIQMGHVKKKQQLVMVTSVQVRV